MAKKTKEKWQERLENAQSAYDSSHGDFTHMHKLYDGTYREIDKLFDGDHIERAHVVRNIIQEIIEAEIGTAIPMPKVTAVRKADEDKAKLIEDMIRDKLDRLNMEMLNDTSERMVPTYGAAFWLCEWDNTMCTHDTVGESTLRLLHPQQIVPQPGITSLVSDMDWCIVKLPMTKSKVSKLYQVDIDEDEAEPEIRTGDGSSSVADDMVTVYHAYYRNDNGGIGLYAWCGDTELADYDDYQARRLKRCATCGALESDIKPIDRQTLDGNRPEEEDGEPVKRAKKGTCPYCGGTKWEETSEDFMELDEPPMRSDGTPIFQSLQTTVGTGQYMEDGTEIMTVASQTMQIPYYKPDIFPLEIHRNTSIYGKLIGESDVTKIEDQQNAINRIEEKIIEKAMTGGSYRTVPADAVVQINSKEGKRYIVSDPSKMSMFSKIDMELNVAQELELEEHYYQSARQMIGITDSFQGRTDKTATSGKAKEFAAAQSAGRLESKRKNKEAAYQTLFEMIFKFELAYADEPRPIRVTNDRGEPEYREFNKWDYLEQDEDGEFWWNDNFIFSCDTATPLANNREAMWQETRENFSAGTFGDPGSIETLIMFWQKMELLHYPGAGETKRYLEERLQQQQMEQQQQMMQEQMMREQQMAQQVQENDLARQDAAAQEQMSIIDKARQDAQNAVNANMMPQ